MWFKKSSREGSVTINININVNGDKLLAKVDDLVAAVASLGDTITRELALISAALSNVGTPDSALDPIITSVNNLKAVVEDEISKLPGTPTTTP